ncbi:MAG TPA: hypothetical protein VF188_07015 [Longimicrobiales bacterium]
MPYRLTKLPGALLAATILAGCAGTFGSAPPATEREIRIRVTNNNWTDATVYLVRNGARTRLGTVTSMNRVLLSVPPAIFSGGSSIRLLIDLIGSSASFLTESILVAPGQVIDFTVENNLHLSNYAVW